MSDYPSDSVRDRPGNQESAAFDYTTWRERYILTILRIASVLGVALVLFSYPNATNSARALFISLYFILLAVTLLPMRYSIRSYSLLGIAYAIGLNALFEWGPFIDGSLFLLVFVILAGVLFDARVDVSALVISAGTIFGFAVSNWFGIFQASSPKAPIATMADWAIYLADFSILGIALVVAIEQFKREFARVIQQTRTAFQDLALQSSKLEEMVTERTGQLETKAAQLRAANTIARDVAEIRSIADLLEVVVNSAAEQFGYYHVGLYLLDENNRNVFLQASSSIPGRQLIGQGFRVGPDRSNAINVVIEQKRVYISSDTAGGVFIKDPNFPLTRSRMVLPLSARGEVIGVLDLHSDHMRAFSPDDAEVVQALADLVAISIDNVRLLDETKGLLRQLESYTASQTRDIWTKVTSRHIPAYQYTPAGVRPMFSPAKQEKADGNLLVPLVLHGESIGNINLRRKGSTASWSERERELIEKIADQVALALENSRLVDEAQRSAHRDQMIANVSSRVRETLDVESVLRTAATELRKVFDLKEAEISVGMPQAEPARVRKNTSSLRLR